MTAKAKAKTTTRSAEQEARRLRDNALVRRIHAGDMEAQRELIAHYQGFIMEQVISVVGPGQADEFAALGIEAFVKALKSYNPDHGVMLLSYVGAAIWQRLTKVKRAERTLIRRPDIKKYRSVSRLVHQRYRQASVCNSLDERMPSGLLKYQPSVEHDSAEDATTRQRVEALQRAIPTLPTLWQQVIYGRMNGMTLMAIGREQRLSKERVRQIENEAHDALAEFIHGERI